IGPHARQAWTPRRGYFYPGQGIDHDFLERAQVAMNVASGAFELQNRIADQLAGAVIGDLAAARNAMDGNAGAPGDKVALVGAASQRVDVRMFEQQERVADSIELARADYGL